MSSARPTRRASAPWTRRAVARGPQVRARVRRHRPVEVGPDRPRRRAADQHLYPACGPADAATLTPADWQLVVEDLSTQGAHRTDGRLRSSRSARGVQAGGIAESTDRAEQSDGRARNAREEQAPKA